MLNQLQLQRQIQEEIDREAKIDREIESIVKKILKRNKQFYRIPESNGCDVVLSFLRNDLTKYNIFLYKEDNEAFKKLSELKGVTLFYLKNKCTHDAKLNTCGFIRTYTPYEGIVKKYSK